MRATYLLVAAIVMAAAGCASTPIATDLASVAANPSEFRNEYIRITAPVLDNPVVKGNDYRTWSFTLGTSADYRIVASEEGFNPSTIDRAYRLVEEARQAGEPVTVTGKLRVGPYSRLESGMELELISIRYRDTEINTDKGPFVHRYSYPYQGPLFLHFGFHHGHHDHHGHH